MRDLAKSCTTAEVVVKGSCARACACLFARVSLLLIRHTIGRPDNQWLVRWGYNKNVRRERVRILMTT